MQRIYIKSCYELIKPTSNRHGMLKVIFVNILYTKQEQLKYGAYLWQVTFRQAKLIHS